jgi:hypothetical protein
MSSILNKRSATKGRELPWELKYNCLKHLNDELMRRVKRLEDLLSVGNGQEEAGEESCKEEPQAGDQASDGLHVEQRGEIIEEQG